MIDIYSRRCKCLPESGCIEAQHEQALIEAARPRLTYRGGGLFRLEPSGDEFYDKALALAALQNATDELQ